METALRSETQAPSLGGGLDALLSVGPGRESIDIAVGMTVHDPAGDVDEMAHRLTPLILQVDGGAEHRVYTHNARIVLMEVD